MGDLVGYSDQGLALLMIYGPKLLLSIVTLVIGLWAIKAIVNAVSHAFERKEYDPSLETFILGAAGLAVGMALSGTLQNFAGGVMILIFKRTAPSTSSFASG